MLLAKKRAADRREWLEAKGDLADLGVDPRAERSFDGAERSIRATIVAINVR